MRLLNVHTLTFREFFDSQVPAYMILSHRWGEQEVSYKDFCKGRLKDSPGWKKIVDYCEFVRDRRDGNTVDCRWVWIDTCCIDKKSSAELSQAVNSMFNWYREANTCHVYLADVCKKNDSDTEWIKELRSSDWFRRGWTLQELLAPRWVVFCDRNWTPLGYSGKLSRVRSGTCFDSVASWIGKEIAQISKIPLHCLGSPEKMYRICVAKKMSWASKRETTRKEDEAYCLLGLFGVNMPLLYGEGSRAFLRLQEEIIKRSTDDSIFAWFRYPWNRDLKRSGVLAPSPKSFVDSGNVFQSGAFTSLQPYSITNMGLEMKSRIHRVRGHRLSGSSEPKKSVYVMRLNCVNLEQSWHGGHDTPIDILLSSEYADANEILSRPIGRLQGGIGFLKLAAGDIDNKMEDRALYIQTGEGQDV